MFRKSQSFSNNSNQAILVDTCRQGLHENYKWIVSISNGVYTLFKKPFLLIHSTLSKCFIYNRVRLFTLELKLDCCMVQQFLSYLDHDDFYSFDKKKVFFLWSNLLTTHKKNLITRKIVLTYWFTINQEKKNQDFGKTFSFSILSDFRKHRRKFWHTIK